MLKSKLSSAATGRPTWTCPFFARARFMHRTDATAAVRDPEASCQLFDELALEHCPVARVSLAFFPPGDFGWQLRPGDVASPLALPTANLNNPRAQADNPHVSSSRCNSNWTAVDPHSHTLSNPSLNLTDIAEPTALAGDSAVNLSSPGSGDSPLTLLSVPLHLCLSHEIPGCSPPAWRSPALRGIFSAGSDLPWELPLAAALLWSCHRHDAAASDASSSPAAAIRAGGERADPAVDGAVVRVGVHARGGGGLRHDGGVTTTGDSSGGGILHGGDDAGASEHDAAFAAFWRRYRSLLPPLGELTTLLFFSEDELRELQDLELAAEAHAWQRTVREAYDKWIDTASFREEMGGEAPSLEAWRWAVGCVESRAFGFRAATADGRELHAYVPFFCLANFQPGAPTLHVLRLEPSRSPPPPNPGPGPSAQPGPAAGPPGDGSTTSCGALGSSCGMSVDGAPTQRRRPPAASWEPTADMMLLLDQLRLSAPAGPQRLVSERPRQGGAEAVRRRRPGSSQPQPETQLHIDYGGKDNRALLYQYGFVLQGNPYDRLKWDGRKFDSSWRIRRDWVYNMAEQLSREDWAGATANQDPLLRTVGGDITATQRRFRSAAASIVEACGWRNLRERRLVSRDSELRTLSALGHCVETQLRAFPTTAEQDAQLLLRLGCREDRGSEDTAGALQRGCKREEEGLEASTASPGTCCRSGGESGWMVRRSLGEEKATNYGSLELSAVTARQRAAAEYRLECKLLLLAALELLLGLRRSLEDPGNAGGGA